MSNFITGLLLRFPWVRRNIIDYAPESSAYSAWLNEWQTRNQARVLEFSKRRSTDVN